MEDEAAARGNIFQHPDGRAVAFYFHSSIKSKGARKKLQDSIESFGGCVVHVEENADIILVNERHLYAQSLESMRLGYSLQDDEALRKYIEPQTFVKKCVNRGEYYHELPERKGMGGPTRAFRVEYEPKDDERLARYIASRCPDPASGGRTGNGIYQDLVDLEPQFSWVSRHTWQSWRERYRKRKDFFDKWIARLVVNPPNPRTRYCLDRQLSKRQRRAKPPVPSEESSDLDSSGKEEEEAEEPQLRRLPAVPQVGDEDVDLHAYSFEDDGFEIIDNQAAAGPSSKRTRRPTELQTPSPARKRQKTSNSRSDRDKLVPASSEGDHDLHNSLFGESDYDNEVPQAANTQMTLVNSSPRLRSDDGIPSTTQATLVPSPKRNTGTHKADQGRVLPGSPSAQSSPPPVVLSEKARGKQREILRDDDFEQPQMSERHENDESEEDMVDELDDSAQDDEMNIAVLLTAVDSLSTSTTAEKGSPSPVTRDPTPIFTPPTSHVNTLPLSQRATPPPTGSQPPSLARPQPGSIQRQSDLETDDEQTQQALSQLDRRISQPTPAPIVLPPAEKSTAQLPRIHFPVARVSDTPLMGRKWRKPPAVPAASGATTNTLRSSRAHNVPGPFMSTPRPRTSQQTTAVRLREGSVSSVQGVFPSPGTRARAVRDRFEDEEKLEVWVPPAGTRAALVSRSK
ncbi:hypothetical protein HGRIS_004735 [Hohenbuehelia grisea]|uniref:DNA-binding protein RAP1 n=1 Tax=Hohenbuehelia grisea TaxID=104357 RepID=A0ABR3JD77_9AGAR